MIFFSHLHDDEELATPLSELIRRSLPKLKPKEAYYQSSDEEYASKPGAKFEDDILKRIRASTVVLALVTPGWRASRWLAVECAIGVALKKEVIPLLCSDRLPDRMPPFLGFDTKLHVQIDVRKELESFVTRLGNLIGEAPIPDWWEWAKEFQQAHFNTVAPSTDNASAPVHNAVRHPHPHISNDARAMLDLIATMADPGEVILIALVQKEYPVVTTQFFDTLRELADAGLIAREKKGWIRLVSGQGDMGRGAD